MHEILERLKHRAPVPVTVLDPPEQLEAALEAWAADGVEVRRALGSDELFVLAFVRSPTEVEQHAPQIIEALAEAGTLWLAYATNSSRNASDLSRDGGWQPLGDLGFALDRPAAVVGDWSAVRLRRTELARVDPGVLEHLAGLQEPRRTEVRLLHESIRAAAPGLPVAMRGEMIGYGSFHYRYASGREGDSALIALASLKSAISVYVNAVEDGRYVAESAQGSLGAVSVGRSCIRIKRVADVDLDALVEVIRRAVAVGGAGAVRA